MFIDYFWTKFRINRVEAGVAAHLHKKDIDDL